MSAPVDEPTSTREIERAASRLELVALALLAVSIRTLFPSAAFFGIDQVGTLENGRAVLAGDIFIAGPPIGWSTLTLGALYNQVAALALAVRDSFADTVALIATLHGLAVVGYHALFRRLMDLRVARLAGLLLALHPTSVAMGASPVSSSLVLPTSLVFVAGIVHWCEARDPRGFAVACLGASLLVQAHGTTVLLLPFFAVGLRRRAPIGDVGLIGLFAALLLLSPNISDNLRALLDRPEHIRHAGSIGAPLGVAALRAAFLEAHVFGFVDARHGMIDALMDASAYVLGASTLGGLLVMLRRDAPPMVRALIVCGLVLPTLAVIAIPRGALYYYLEQTLVFRSLAAAAAVVALHDAARRTIVRRAASLIVAGATAAACLAAAHPVLARAAAHRDGYLRPRMERVDLRAPLDMAASPTLVPTIAMQDRLGRTFSALGARRASLRDQLRGPFGWVLRDSTPVYVSADPGGERVGPARSRFLVLHRADALGSPGGEATTVGPFRVYRFEDLIEGPAHRRDATSWTLAPSEREVLLHVVVPQGAHLASARVDGHPRTLVARETMAGFVTHEVRLSPSVRPRTVDLELREPSARTVIVRPDVEVYAFETSAR